MLHINCYSNDYYVDNIMDIYMSVQVWNNVNLDVNHWTHQENKLLTILIYRYADYV